MGLTGELQKIIERYDSVLGRVDKKAQQAQNRAYGGVLRATKGKLQEDITESLVNAAWKHIGGDSDLLEINSKKISIPIKNEYIDRITEPKVKKHIQANVADYVYRLSVDKHIFIREKFVIGIECKSYAENAMLKRILVDFDLLKTKYPKLSCYLFQMESQLGGDYRGLKKPVYGSHSTHTLQSYFSCDLNIVTLLEGERNINRPIHKYFKPLKIEVLRNAVELLAEDMRRFL